MNIIQPEIKNPQRTVLRRWLFVDIFFIILGLHSFFTFDINSFDGMFVMVSITVVLTSLFFIKPIFKNIKAIDNAIKNRVMLAHWKYTAKEWLNYLNHEKSFRFKHGKLMAYFLSGITVLIFVPFILIIPDGKFAMFLVMIALFGMYFFMGLVFPKIVFFVRKNRVGEVILLERGILVDKEFHTWDFPLSKFNYAKFLNKPYGHLEVTYDFIDRTGPRSYTVNIPVPKNVKEIKKIISKFK